MEDERKTGKKSPPVEKKQIEIIGPVAGSFRLPYNIGQIVAVGDGGVSEQQAAELIENGYAKEIK